jgi:hypothetical protein
VHTELHTHTRRVAFKSGFRGYLFFIVPGHASVRRCPPVQGTIGHRIDRCTWSGGAVSNRALCGWSLRWTSRPDTGNTGPPWPGGVRHTEHDFCHLPGVCVFSRELQETSKRRSLPHQLLDREYGACRRVVVRRGKTLHCHRALPCSLWPSGESPTWGPRGQLEPKYCQR